MSGSVLIAAGVGALDANSRAPAIILLWICVGAAVATLLWPGRRGVRRARQVFAVAVLGFREGIRLKVLWTVFALALIPGLLAYFSDADGTHVGRAYLVLNYCISGAEVLGAVLIVLLSALSVAREIESRIMHTFGAKPIPRWAILAGKALGFWAIDLLFLAGMTLLAAVLVRAVPARPEARSAGKLAVSGTWEDLQRNALTTRQFQIADNETGDTAGYKLARPGTAAQWFFSTEPAQARNGPLAVRFQLSSSLTYAPQIERVGLMIGYAGAAQPLVNRIETVPQDRAFELFVEPKDVSAGRLVISIAASSVPLRPGYTPPSVMGTVRLGVAADGIAANLLKAFLLMALQGFILALITTSWSGVLSFPVTVALGAILVLGGEMSRHALELLESSASRAQVMSLGIQVKESGIQEGIAGQLRLLLGLLPDFRAAGGPAAFTEGTFLSGWALAHAVLMQAVVRGLGWSVPGIMCFYRREVGR